MKLGVNVDHVATLRQARKTIEPDPVWAAIEAELAGADGITIHLREDRRHIQERDLKILREVIRTKLNLEMAPTKEMVKIACSVRPDTVTLVPERREEVTTEGGLDIASMLDKLRRTNENLKLSKIKVGVFIDPVIKQLAVCKKINFDHIEINTGKYSEAKDPAVAEKELMAIRNAVVEALDNNIKVNAGHGLNYKNVIDIVRIDGIEELNIGHSIIARSVFVGIRRAVEEMVLTINKASESRDRLI